MNTLVIPLSASDLAALQSGKVVAPAEVRDAESDSKVDLTVLIEPPRRASEPGT